jgi:hypothetical protein
VISVPLSTSYTTTIGQNQPFPETENPADAGLLHFLDRPVRDIRSTGISGKSDVNDKLTGTGGEANTPVSGAATGWRNVDILA